jgi:CheY-like chemotaxis protein
MSTDSLKARFVLLADDDDDDTMLFVEATEQLSSKVNVMLANDGQELLNMLHSSPKPDVIFLDLNMPKKSGLECLTAIRSDSNLDNTPVVIYSTSQSRKDIDVCFNGGASHYIIKPYDFEDIIFILKKLFEEMDNINNIKPSKDKFVINPGRDNIKN